VLPPLPYLQILQQLYCIKTLVYYKWPIVTGKIGKLIALRLPLTSNLGSRAKLRL
jgi:hypothetical protein